MLDLPFTDPISLNLFATTEWDTVLPDANLIAWSRNVKELIKSFIDEDYRAYLEADRDKILNTVASIAAKEWHCPGRSRFRTACHRGRRPLYPGLR